MFIHVTKDFDMEPSGMSIFVIRDALFHLGTTIRIERPLSDVNSVPLVPTVKNTLNFVNAKTIRPYWDMVSPPPEQSSQLSISEIVPTDNAVTESLGIHQTVKPAGPESTKKN